jgi:WD40 repeat protein
MNTLEGHTHRVSCVAFDGTTIVSGSDDKTVCIWRVPYNTDECERVIEGYTGRVLRVWLCTVPNEHIVVTESYERVYVHDIHTGDQVNAPIECFFSKLS